MRSWPAPQRWCCSPTTTASTTSRWQPVRRSSWTAGAGSPTAWPPPWSSYDRRRRVHEGSRPILGEPMLTFCLHDITGSPAGEFDITPDELSGILDAIGALGLPLLSPRQ